MAEFRSRSRSQSVSIPAAPIPSLNLFTGRGHSLLPPPKGEQVSFPGVPTPISGNANTSSHWKTLSNPFRSSRTKSMAAPRATEALQPTPKQRTIVRKSLRIPGRSQATMMSVSAVKSKSEEVDSDDEGTLVSVSGAPEMPAPIEKSVQEAKGPVIPMKQSLRVSRKILTVIPDIYDKAGTTDRSSVQDSQQRVLQKRKSQHWGLMSSPYQPEFVIENETENDLKTAFTSLSPPPRFDSHRRHASFNARPL